ncbi:hypothetical protein ANO14919_010160 [Xylariales sp. No.14919]|nr:hypothetical protein ANO14919_010160 [Xylariales sp. No.14919]
MTRGKGRADGDYFPFTLEAPPVTLPLPQPELKSKPSASKPVRSLTPRGQRFSKLSDAYLNITSRVGSHDTIHKDLDQSQSSSAGSTLSPVASPRLVKSQDDLQTPGSASAMRGCMKKNRYASVDSIELLGGASPRMGCRDNHPRLSLSEQTENELLDLDSEPHNTTASTIEGILAQYDGCTSNLKTEYDESQETKLPISQPPHGSLPDAPPTNMQAVSSVRQSVYDSPVPNSSITDSQHLLDAEAQAHELEEARRALVPLPLKITQPRRDVEISQEQHYDAFNDKGAFKIHGEDSHVYNPFVNREDESYKTYLQPPMERDISRNLRRLSGYNGHGTGTSYSLNVHEDSAIRQAKPQGKVFGKSSLPIVGTAEKPLRHIKVVIGREPEVRKNSQDDNGSQTDVEDGDWVTEGTSDAGFGFTTSPLPGRPLTGPFKKTGSSLADYSDDGYEDMVDRFGSHERIIQTPTGDEQYEPYNVRRSKESKFAVFLPRRHIDALPEGVDRRWGNTKEQGPSQFRPQILRKDITPVREIGGKRMETSGRLVFDFDQNAPPRYEFRDSISEYEPATASTKADYGTQNYGTSESLPSPAPDFIEKKNHPCPTDARFDQSADFEADRNPSGKFSHQNQACQTPIRGQNTGFNIYEADRQNQLEEIDTRQFASASSYYDPPSANSVRSKFNFELLPLSLAQQKNKKQRDSGETNETESAAARLKRKRSIRSIDPETSPLEPPAKAFFTSPDLSLNFLPTDWQTGNPGLEDTPTPFAMGRSNGTTSGQSHIYRKVSSSGGGDNSSSFGTPSTAGRVGYGRWEYLDYAGNRYRCKPRPGLVAPDDYVSDRANSARQSFFCLLATLSVLPFVGVLVLSGAFSEAFKWATRGEVNRLTARQRRFIKWMLLIECILYSGGVVTVVVYFAVKSKTQN